MAQQSSWDPLTGGTGGPPTSQPPAPQPAPPQTPPPQAALRSGGPLARAGTPGGLFGDTPAKSLVHSESPLAPKAAPAPPASAPPSKTPQPPSFPPPGGGRGAAPLQPTPPRIPPQTQAHPAPAGSHPLAQPPQDSASTRSPSATPQAPPSPSPAVDIAQLAASFLGRSVPVPKRPTAAEVPHKVEGLRLLAKAGSWRALLQLSAEILRGKQEAAQGPGPLKPGAMDPVERLTVMQFRLVGQLRSRAFKAAADELAAMGDLSCTKYKYESYPGIYGSKQGSLVPFSMHVLQAEVLFAAGRQKDSIDALYLLLHQVTADPNIFVLHVGDAKQATLLLKVVTGTSGGVDVFPLEGVGAAVCAAIVKTALVNFHLELRDYYPTVQILSELHAEFPEQSQYGWALCRVHLMFGGIQAATSMCATMEAVPGADVGAAAEVRGCIAISQGKYDEALQHMNAALELDPTRTHVAVNLAVCYLYSKQIVKAVQTLESLVKADPCNALTYAIAFNLCTLYDLQGTEVAYKKRVIHHLSKSYAAEDFDPTACKL